jgi:hypothetical protein
MNIFRRSLKDRPLEPDEKARVISMTRDGYDAERIALKLGLARGRVNDYLNRPLESSEKMLVRQLSKDGHDSIHIARELGSSPIIVAAYLERQRELDEERDSKKRRTNPAAAAMASIQESIAGDVAASIEGNAGLRQTLVKAQIDSVLAELGAKKDPPKGNALVEAISYITNQLGEGGMTNLFRMAVPATQREAVLESQLAQAIHTNQQLVARIQAGQQPAPAALPSPAQPEAPAAAEPSPAELAAAEAEASPADQQQPTQEAKAEMDLPALMQRWMGMAPAVAAAEASVVITEPDKPIRPPWVSATPRELLGLPASELVVLLTNNLALRQGVPVQVREFLATPHGQDFWRQFQAGLRLPAPAEAA